jgi:exportin-1
VDGLFESRNDLSSFKNHIRDFLVQSKEFSAQVIIFKNCIFLGCGKQFFLIQVSECKMSPMQDNKDLYAEEAAAQRERERQRMLSIPGLIAPSELQDEMLDS